VSRSRTRSLDLAEEPSSGEGPKEVCASRGDAEDLSRLLDCKSYKVTKFDQFRGLRIGGGELRKGFVQSEEVIRHLGSD